MKRVLIALILALAVPLGVTTPALAATIGPSSTNVAPGSTITFTLAGFPAATQVTTTLNTACSGGTQVSAASPVTTDASGAATGAIGVPSTTTPGSYCLIATGGGQTATAAITVSNPTITVNPTTTSPGQTVTVS